MNPHRSRIAAFLLLASTALQAQTCPTVIDVNTGNSGKDGAWPTWVTCAFGNTLYFSARTSTYGPEPWTWDSTSGAKLLKDIRSGSTGSNPQGFTACCLPIGGRTFFAAWHPTARFELWMTDGSTVGTVVVKDINPSSSSNPRELTAGSDRLFFTANDGTNGIELWSSDGTSAGTKMVKNIASGSSSSQPGEMVWCQGKLFFTAYTSTTGRELYVSDGTTAGTKLVKEIGAGTKSGSISEITCCGDKVFFHASSSTHGNELWMSDGTATGTQIVKDINQNSGSSSPTKLVCCGDTLYFTAIHPFYGREVWKSDGTANGTVLVKDVRSGSLSSLPNFLTCANGRLFFSAYGSGTNGTEVWVSDGTPSGTKMAKDIVSGSGSSFPSEFVAVGAGVCFAARTASGSELWFSDGTSTGTKIVCDLYPGSNSSTPQHTVTCGGHLLFTASTPATGNELFWIKRPGATHEVLGHGGAPGYPTLDLNKSPILGTTVNINAQGPSAYTGFLLVGPSLVLPKPAIPPLMIGGCDWVDAFTFGIILTSTTSTTMSVPAPIPNQPSLNGAKMNLQMWWVSGSTTPMMQVSNGLQIVLGTGSPQ